MSSTTKSGWRDLLPVHPAAEMFPLMSKGELAELADDIKKNGLRIKVDLFRDVKDDRAYLLDGRNRLDALELLGRKITVTDDGPVPLLADYIGKVLRSDDALDPVAYVTSKNIKRRHLTSEQKRDAIAKLLALDPERSDRQIAEAAGSDHKVVGRARAKMEARGALPHVNKRTDSKGRKQPARRKKAKTKPAGTPPMRSSEAPATSVPPESPDKTAKTSAHNLAELTFALRTYAPRITVAADRERARALALELLGDGKASGRLNGQRDPDTADMFGGGS